MATVTLTDARIRALRPRRSAHDIRDAKLKGFGVRVLPSGRKRFFIHCQRDGERIWRIVGGADDVSAGEARSRAAAMLAAIRRGRPAPSTPEDTVFEAVAEAAFRRHGRSWKPGTLKVNRSYLRSQILPRFAGRQVADINRRDVVRWFASLRATPVAADRSVPVLSVIMREAERMGFREEGSNPCLGIRRYRRKGRERFLSDAEVRSLACCLDAHESERPLSVAAVRLLLLTGCRKSEIVTLRWADYREGALFLRDSKTGPRTVWLSRSARDVLDGIRRTSTWVFPGRKRGGPRSRGWLDSFWSGARAEAGLGDVRLHDLRHVYASIALRQGESVLAIGRLLGHRSAETTLKYTHHADSMAAEAAAIVGAVLAEG
ncbi:MAG: site-specific integrase [Boseongicola sp. SB0677_bin_26]|nr:site-specific integrase [Boseongicola sp. SB0665_bin_10]MYG26780.1 site-specific integrase [Boseongicola sp. SB0677_bin_26]